MISRLFWTVAYCHYSSGGYKDDDDARGSFETLIEKYQYPHQKSNLTDLKKVSVLFNLQ